MKPLVDPALERYAEDHTSPTPELLVRLEEETRASVASPQMLTGRVEGQLLQLLVKMVGARRIIEVGMYTGYSALMMAEALPDDGELITCDVDPKAEAVARRYFEQSPHGHKIHVRMGPALTTLASLDGPFDLAFVDADKQNYPAYYERLVELVRPSGLIVVDNVLWSGEVLDPQDAEARAIHALNERVQSDPRVDNVLATIRDGVLIARKR